MTSRSFQTSSLQGCLASSRPDLTAILNSPLNDALWSGSRGWILRLRMAAALRFSPKAPRLSSAAETSIRGQRFYSRAAASHTWRRLGWPRCVSGERDVPRPFTLSSTPAGGPSLPWYSGSEPAVARWLARVTAACSRAHVLAAVTIRFGAVRTETMVRAPRISSCTKPVRDGLEGRCRAISSTSTTASGRCTT